MSQRKQIDFTSLRGNEIKPEALDRILSSAQGGDSLPPEKYRKLFEILPLPAFVVDDQGAIVEANSLANDLLESGGYGSAQQKAILNLFDGDSCRKTCLVLGERGCRAPQIIELVRLRFSDEWILLCDVYIVHLEDESEDVGRSLMLLVDRGAEIALQKSDAFKNAILDSMPAQIAVLDSNGIIIAVNEAWRRFSFENGAMADKNLHIGVRYLDVCQPCAGIEPEEGALEAYHGISQVLDGRLPSFRVDYPCHSPNEERWFSLSATRFGQDTPGVVITHTNITESKRAEMAVRDSHETLRGILKTTKDGFWQLDASGVLFDVNSTYCQLSGYSREELLGMHISVLDAITAPGKIDWHIRRVMSAGSDQFETQHRRKDGSIWDVEISATYRDAAGGQLLVFLRDITQRKQAETALNDALEAAKIADQSKDAFFANVTHELRTPLSAVIGFSSLARPLCTNDKQRDYLDKVSSAGKTLAGIIDDLLDLSKITSGHLEFENKPFSLRKLVQRSLSVLSFEAEKKGLALIEQVAEEIPDVLLGDALRVEQIFLNLLSNAVKFTQFGHVALRIKQLTRDAQRVGLDISVEDTGIGLSEEEIGYLFKPFSQAGVFVSHQFGGTGLGLSICKQLAEAMGGEIGVVSSKGRGSTFLVKLWLHKAPHESLAEERLPANLPKKIAYRDARVLVVDDQQLNREVVQGMLALVGIKPVLACNGEEAMSILQSARENFDLVLMDIQMPVLDGLSATRQIRQIERFIDLPVIAMTANTMLHERNLGQAAGMSGHIGKPFDEEAFFCVLEKWIPQAKQCQAISGSAEPKSDVGFPVLEGIDTKVGLSLLLGNEARYRHWLSEFVSEGPATLSKIYQALELGDSASANMAAHMLRGRAGILGMKTMSRIAGELESAIESATPTDELLVALKQDMFSICSVIEDGLGACPTTPKAIEAPVEKLPVGPLPDPIKRLIISLEAGDGDCDTFVADCLDMFEGTSWVPRLQQARSLIQKFDFAAASKLFSDDK
ncbi:MAG: PAS domain S-box protein [Rhodocyclaceae bacterium]|nr:PAS domain S-box protein [Rhodocyclaceae bacterium]